MAEKEVAKELERIYVIPLRKAKFGPTSKAAPHGIRDVKAFVMKHMKVDSDNIWLDSSVNETIWARGKFKVPSKIRVRVIKYEDGIVEVTVPEVSDTKSRREIIREEKETKIATPILRREEDLPSEEDMMGTEDYDVVPTAGGDVKIKKKKESHDEVEAEIEIIDKQPSITEPFPEDEVIVETPEEEALEALKEDAAAEPEDEEKKREELQKKEAASKKDSEKKKKEAASEEDNEEKKE